MRHGDAESHAGDGQDFNRELSSRGRIQCQQAGRWLVEHEIKPDVVVGSPAVRAQQSVEWVCTMIEYPRRRIEWERIIYEATPSQLIRTLDRLVDSSVVMIVGHNPGVESLCRELVGRPAGDLAVHLRPSGLANIEFDWTPDDFADGDGRLVDLVEEF